MVETLDGREELLERIAALERRVAALERRSAAPDLICPRCGGEPEALALRTNPELHDREEVWVRCKACGDAGWQPRAALACGRGGAAQSSRSQKLRKRWEVSSV
jgi:uncharacterized protein with PIN domain